MFTKKRHSLKSLVPGYLEYCSACGQSARTVEGKRGSIGQFLRWCEAGGLRYSQQVTPEVLEAYRRHLAGFRQQRTHRPLDIATQRNRLTAVRLWFRYLGRCGNLKTDPAAEIELPRVGRRLPKGFLTHEEIERILESIPIASATGLRDRAIAETFYAAGIRRMELANLDIEDVDLLSGMVHVNQGKGGKDRRIPIASRSCKWVARYLDQARPNLAGAHSGRALYLDSKGLRFRGHQLTKLVAGHIREAGVRQSGSCHLFRHSLATLMHENGADIRYIQEMLGHASISTTQIYTHVTSPRLRAVYARTHPAAAAASENETPEE